MTPYKQESRDKLVGGLYWLARSARLAAGSLERQQELELDSI